MEAINKWNGIVIEGILSFKEFGIKEVKNFETIASLTFNKEKYPEIVDLINEQNWDDLKQFDNPEKKGFREYLEVVKFSDQNKHPYLATIYDNDEMMQNPQLLI